jgi:RNA polymerase sigma-70 factor (ECF subfamily)
VELTPHDRLARTVRVEGARILATLVRTVGNLQVAEDAVQEAVLAALREWPHAGVPDEPRAWLTVTARRKAIDALRREGARGAKEREGVDLMARSTPDTPPDSVVRDDLLRLVFTCCHPALAAEARVALALRTLCGLSTAQVAAVLLTTEPAMAKRLTRTRQKIAVSHIPYRVPSDAELPERLPAVCGVVHALYTSGHAPLDGPALVDVDVCAEAVRLARLVHDLLPDEAMPSAVLALLLLTEARRSTRLDASGEVVPLAEQNRSRWDTALVAEGRALLDESLRRTAGVADPYQLQAAIAVQHVCAESYAGTDWAEIVRLFDLLLSVAPSPAAAVARAVAVAEADGPDAGLDALSDVPPGPRWHAVRGELLARAGRYAEAVEAADEALAGDLTGPVRRHQERLRRDWARRVHSASATRSSAGR